jgi:hypothetical protein
MQHDPTRCEACGGPLNAGDDRRDARPAAQPLHPTLAVAEQLVAELAESGGRGR